ncbi:succinylglutamate desuccinylase/aspartoacylase family protein [Cyanobacteria bacterium FACHB-63]|nr:succinylglutamate desuccinylase/aspartoacylase family protein [Cyanobacteria bacterium FACHB-63]
MIPTIETIPLQHLASGDYLSLQFYKFVGDRLGKKVYLQSNLHGGEIAGNVVLHRLMEWLGTLAPSQLVGELWVVPVCNPAGVNVRSHHYASGRFESYSGHNWNRIFWDYEKKGANIQAFAKSQLELEPRIIQQNFRHHIQQQFLQLRSEIDAAASVPFHEKYRYVLQSLSLDADYVLDLHTSSDLGLTYVYYFRDRQDSAPLFLLEAGILLDDYDGDAFDEAFIKPWLALEQCFTELERPMRFEVEAYTLELGSGMQIDSEAVDRGIRGIQNYLITKGVLDLSDFPRITPPPMRLVPRNKQRRYYAPAGGVIQSRVPVGAVVEAGTILYELLRFSKDGAMPTVQAVQAQQPGVVFDAAISQIVNEGEYVVGMLED